MLTLFYRQPRITILAICLILVSGLSSYVLLPRMEDPLLTERVAKVNTLFPGADAERVEALVTEKLEDELQEIDEIKKLRSVSRAGASSITIELRDDVYGEEADIIWSRLRDKVGDTVPQLPQGAFEPQFEDLNMKAYAHIVGITWDSEVTEQQPVSYAILRRLAKQLEDILKGVPGTEEVDTFGDPDEEILVEIDVTELASRGLTVQEVAQQIRASDAKVSAGQLRGQTDLLVEVQGELDSLDRVARTPTRTTEDGQFVPLSDIATIRRTIADPPTSLAWVQGKPAIALGVTVRETRRVDHWSDTIDRKLEEFSATLPAGISAERIFRQNDYVASRLTDLLKNLLFGAAAVGTVVFVMMGWRSALIVSSALPLSAFMVLSGMRFLGIPIHQMSICGLIVALGLLIDNAIVIVDEVTHKLREGQSPQEAVRASVGHLAIPLLGSTLTTALAFAPIALMPGPSGEFVGAISVSVILAIFSSLFLALTIVPALTALGVRSTEETDGQPWWRAGIQLPGLACVYHRSLRFVLARPALGLIIGILLPLSGFAAATQLPEQFFPPADRDQVQIEVDMPSQTPVAETMRVVQRMREQLLEHNDVEAVTWFVGESAPSFYYNVIPWRRNQPSYGQALVQLNRSENTAPLIHELQRQLDAEFPQARVLVRQLEQGPPFDAPVELRLYGPDMVVLRQLGNQLRLIMSEIPNVIHTRSDAGESVPKVALAIPEEDIRLTGLSYAAVARQLNASLEGAIGGSILEATEELPVRVRVGGTERSSLDSIASTDLMPGQHTGVGSAVPLGALANVELLPESSAITRLNGRRMNDVKAYLAAGVLPAVAQAEFIRRVEASGFQLPPGYTMDFGGESQQRNDAIGNLLGSVGVLLVMMVATLVLSFSSFRMASVIGVIAILSAGPGLAALWVFGHPFGFMAIIGTMGLIGVAINDSIVVLAAIREDEQARTGDRLAVLDVVLRSTRHVVATTLTTIAGFIPLLLGGGGFWPPLAIAIAGGVGGATILALYFAPSAYILTMCRGRCLEAALDGPVSHRDHSTVQPSLS